MGVEGDAVTLFEPHLCDHAFAATDEDIDVDAVEAALLGVLGPADQVSSLRYFVCHGCDGRDGGGEAIGPIRTRLAMKLACYLRADDLEWTCERRDWARDPRTVVDRIGASLQTTRGRSSHGDSARRHRARHPAAGRAGARADSDRQSEHSCQRVR